MPYAVIMLSREVIVAITEQVFLRFVKTLHEKEISTLKEKCHLNNSKGKMECRLLEIFHVTPTRATIVQKSTKYAKLTRGVLLWVTFPLFAAGTNRTI